MQANQPPQTTPVTRSEIREDHRVLDVPSGVSERLSRMTVIA